MIEREKMLTEKELNKLGQDIENLENKIFELKSKIDDALNNEPKQKIKWRAVDANYYYIGLSGKIHTEQDLRDGIDDFLYNSGNYFRTLTEAEAYKENLITKQKLKDLAIRLNKGVEIDWNDERQTKYYISYDYKEDLLFKIFQRTNKIQGSVYCLDENFLKIAIKEIGEEKLINLIKGGI